MDRAKRQQLRSTYESVDTGYGVDVCSLLDHCDQQDLVLTRLRKRFRRLENAILRLLKAVKAVRRG